MTHKKHFCIIVLILVLVLVGSAFWYTRPMTLAQLYPSLSLSECKSVTISYQIHDENSLSEERTELTLTTGEDNFAALLSCFEDCTFRRTLSNLLPSGTQMHTAQAGEYQWDIIFYFDGVTLPDGSTASGALLYASDFFGKLSLSFDGTTTRYTVPNQEQWRFNVLAAFQANQ